MTARTCAMPDCDGTVLARGLCAADYRRVRTLERAAEDVPSCSTEDCESDAVAHGLCQLHYRRHRAHTAAATALAAPLLVSEWPIRPSHVAAFVREHRPHTWAYLMGETT